MTLKEAVSSNPYRAGAVAAGVFHTLMRLAFPKKSAWVGSGGYFGLIGIVVPFMIEKKATNDTIRNFACGWRNAFIFIAIGENIYYITKTVKPDVERPVLPLLAVNGAAVFLALKAESTNFAPIQAPQNGGGLTTSSGNVYTVVKSGNKTYTMRVKNNQPSKHLAEWRDRRGNVIALEKVS